jgi:mannose-1-phosphate guanylyltransferase/mannose-6-phosphate isomerase
MAPLIVPVLMSGGSGTRLWPVSRQAMPKQFHNLGAANTLIQDAALRAGGEGFSAPVVVCNIAHAQVARAQLAAVGAAPQALLLEPAARNTAACAVAAAAWIARRDPDALLLLLPADHHITDVAAFRAAVATGAPAARGGALVVFGLKPAWAETGYGYIRAADYDGAVRKVAAFVEKPDQATAEAFFADPAYSWNAGMFLFSARTFLEEARRLAPEAARCAEAAVDEARVDGDLVALGPSFIDAPSISIDYAVMEKTDRAMVAPCEMGWSDVGAWRAIWDLAAKSEAGNALEGDIVAVDVEGCLARTDGPTVVLAGLRDVVVVVENGVVMVSAKDASNALKSAVERLKGEGRGDLL